MTAGALMAAALSSAAIEPCDVSFLLAELMQIRPLELPLHKDKELSPETEELFRSYHSRLLNHEPPQYILGKCWFCGLELEVNPSVLIPRPETEGLVEIALQKLLPGMKVLEIGTGSGSIAIAMHKNAPEAEITATDISANALDTAKRNAQKHDCLIDFQQADIFPESESTYDLLISNPPYISSEEYAELEPRVREHEPREALFAAEDGLEFYINILNQAVKHLNPKGMVLFEHGAEQKQKIINLAASHGFECILAQQDLAGRDRYLGFQIARNLWPNLS